mmetsp:Transcript_108000/g.287542  ORF Transcript_108000/g.287542 Transcript_108000/m.287542 type:complete len:277 (+) Transcript_108000:847-1677(+)
MQTARTSPCCRCRRTALASSRATRAPLCEPSRTPPAPSVSSRAVETTLTAIRSRCWFSVARRPGGKRRRCSRRGLTRSWSRAGSTRTTPGMAATGATTEARAGRKAGSTTATEGGGRRAARARATGAGGTPAALARRTGEAGVPTRRRPTPRSSRRRALTSTRTPRRTLRRPRPRPSTRRTTVLGATGAAPPMRARRPPPPLQRRLLRRAQRLLRWQTTRRASSCSTRQGGGIHTQALEGLERRPQRSLLIVQAGPLAPVPAHHHRAMPRRSYPRI